MKTLIIAEKPSVASDIAKALGKFDKKGDFFENDNLVIASAVGHLFELEPDGEKGSWKLSTLPFIPKLKLVAKEKVGDKIKTLKALFKRSDINEVINACDAGREGELIFRNAYIGCGGKQKIKRMWMQSMTHDSIKDAYKSLKSDKDMQPLYDTALSRSESDWFVGINATRGMSSIRSQGGGFQKAPCGRVQTPTLAMIVNRDLEIEAFVSKDYNEVVATFATPEYKGRWFDPKAPDDIYKIWKYDDAKAIKSRINGKVGKVTDTKKPQSLSPPSLYDLTTLQREANSKFGFPAKMTLGLAQALYEKHKMLTYPRTDSKHLPEDYVDKAKETMGKLDGYLHLSKKAVVKPNKRIFNNAKISDHFAIIPTGKNTTLDDKETKIYDLVVKRFIAAFYPNAEIENTERITIVDKDHFKTIGKVILKPGWMEVYGKGTDSDELLPIKGDVKLTDVEILSLKTKPPARYNEATLLSSMEGAGKFVDDEEIKKAMGKGLGTPATRAQIIEGLILDSYIARDGRDLISTTNGKALIIDLKAMGIEALTKPEMTGEWEQSLENMERGKVSRAKFMEEIKAMTSDIIAKMQKSAGTIVAVEKINGWDVFCPKCKQKMLENGRTFTCKEDELTVWKSVASKELTLSQINTLLDDGKIYLEGMKTKLGKSFAANIVFIDGKMTFETKKTEAAGEFKGGILKESEDAWIGEIKDKNIRVSKNICKKVITKEQAIKLFESGSTDVLEFISKKNKPFRACLKLIKGKTIFEFEKKVEK